MMRRSPGMLNKRMTRKQVAQDLAAVLDYKLQHPATKPPMEFGRGRVKNVADCLPCKCLYPGCGKTMDILTHEHAGQHGFSSKYEMIDAGYVVFYHNGKEIAI
jgi:hypothetical protein